MSAPHKITARGYPVTARTCRTDDGETHDAPVGPKTIQTRVKIEAAKLDAAIAANLKELGYGG